MRSADRRMVAEERALRVAAGGVERHCRLHVAMERAMLLPERFRARVTVGATRRAEEDALRDAFRPDSFRSADLMEHELTSVTV